MVYPGRTGAEDNTVIWQPILPTCPGTPRSNKFYICFLMVVVVAGRPVHLAIASGNRFQVQKFTMLRNRCS